MSLILNIDTALETASVSLAENGKLLKRMENERQKDHASFLHAAIDEIAKSGSLSLKLLSAVAVTIGPGSYTGLRVGMSSAKGICYALNKPLITIGTLEAMANDARKSFSKEKVILCPMVDARRMEVFTALYDTDLNQLKAPTAMILDQNSFGEQLSENSMIFFGNGAGKFRNVVANPNAVFTDVNDIVLSISELSHTRFLLSQFANLSLVEPMYIKEYQN